MSCRIVPISCPRKKPKTIFCSRGRVQTQRSDGKIRFTALQSRILQCKPGDLNHNNIAIKEHLLFLSQVVVIFWYASTLNDQGFSCMALFKTAVETDAYHFVTNPKNLDLLLGEFRRDEKAAFIFALKKGLFKEFIECPSHPKDTLKLQKNWM